MEKTNKEQATKELEKLRKEFDERTKKLEEIINQAEKESIIYKPGICELYYFVDCDGVILRDNWFDYDTDNEKYNMGNCYKTEQEAIDARDARIILTRLQRLADEMNGEKLR